MKRNAEKAKIANETVTKRRKDSHPNKEKPSTNFETPKQQKPQVLHPEVHGAEWHHHHRYNTRLQEEIEGPQEDETLPPPPPQHQYHPEDPGTELHHHHRYNTRLQEEIEGPQSDTTPESPNDGSDATKLITPPRATNSELSPTQPMDLQKKMEPETKKDSVDVSTASSSGRVMDLVLLMLGLMVIATLTMALWWDIDVENPIEQDSGAIIRRRPYKKWHHHHQPKLHVASDTNNMGALKSKIDICNQIALEFQKGPKGIPNLDDHTLFHPPLDSLLGETTKNQLDWLHQVQKARGTATTPATEADSWWEHADWKGFQDQTMELLARLGQQIQG